MANTTTSDIDTKSIEISTDETNNSKKGANNRVAEEENQTIDQRLLTIASQINTVEGWEDFISKYYEAFCAVLAKLETKSNSTEMSNQKPIAVITGGQPGAGKSVLIATYKDILEKKYDIKPVINNADFYRFCVPGSYKIATDFPECASKLTDPVVKLMRKNLMEESIAQGQSIIIENTLGDTIAFDRMRESKVHDIWLALMAVPREESLLSDFERYIKMKESCDVARLVSVEAHDKRYYALDKIANQLENRGVRTLVHSRGKTEQDFAVVEYDSANKDDKRYANVVDAMSQVRAKKFKEAVPGFSARLKTIREKMEGFGMTPDEESELQKLEEIIGLAITKENERGEK